LLASLLDKSLVRRTGERVWMLETIREFAAGQLAADPVAEELRGGHAGFYLAFAAASELELMGPGQPRAIERLASDRDNLRAAFERLLDRDPPAALRLVAALWRFWIMRGYFREGREMLLAALKRAPQEPTEARASALVGAGVLAWEQGDYRESIGLYEEGLACARVTRSTGVEVRALIHLAKWTEFGREEQIRLGEEAIALAGSYGDAWLLGLVTGNQGVLMGRLGEAEKAIELTKQACRLCRETGDVQLTANWLVNLAWCTLEAGDTVEARARLDESLELARLIDNTRGIAGATVNLGFVELSEDDFDQACSCFEAAATIARRLGLRAIGADAVWGFAQVAAARGDRVVAARLAGAADSLGGPTRPNPTASITFIHHLDDARAALGENAWQKGWADGAKLDLDAALRLAVDQ
jgi:tetratricopeptide (TPR) repeat protein